MNRFKPSVQESRTESQCRRKDQVQLLNILDKCTQVLRDDRIWLRNKVKEGDSEIITIFKKYLSKKPLDLPSLQTNLRKHVMRIKEKCKREQLQKFKENMNLGTNDISNLFERNTYNERSSKSISFRKPAPNVMYFDEEDYENERVYRDRNYSNEREEYCREEPVKKQNHIARIKMTDPIEEEDYELEQGISYRSKGHQRNKTGEKSEKVGGQDRLSLPWQKRQNNYLHSENKIISMGLDLGQEEKEEEEKGDQIDQEDEYSSTYNFNQEQQIDLKYTQYQEPPLLPRPVLKSSTNMIDAYSHPSTHSITHTDSNYNSNKLERPKLNIMVPIPSPADQPIISFSGTPSNHQLLQNQHTSNNPYPLEQSKALISSVNRSEYSKQEENLFTSPELLNECRRFLEQSNHKLQQSSHKGLSLENSTYQAGSLENSMCNESSYNFLERLTLGNKRNNITQSINLKDLEPSQTPSNPPTHHYNQPSHKPPQDYRPSSKVMEISELYAEEVFQLIFPGLSNEISFGDYSKIVYQKFMEADKMIRLFKVADKTMINKISASEFGKLLLSNCNYKPSPNPVKQIYTLIDIDRKGFFTLEDFEKFLEQVVDAENQETVTILEICERLFEMADWSKTQRIDYWGLYLIRGTKEFEEFSIFLEQFQFELDVS